MPESANAHDRLAPIQWNPPKIAVVWLCDVDTDFRPVDQKVVVSVHCLQDVPGEMDWNEYHWCE